MTQVAKNTICIWYDHEAEEAAHFYASVFPDSEVKAIHRSPMDNPGADNADAVFESVAELFGLLSTPMLVGVQSFVGWQQRGVVTGANIFSRYLGQSLGAALCGAIFNGAIAQSLAAAPAALLAELPHDIDAVIGSLQGQALPAAADHYLRLAIYTATHHVYVGLAVVALLTLVAVLLTPRHFPAAIETSPAESSPG